MEKVVKKVIKPSFDIEIKAEITGVQKIEANIDKVNKFAIELNDYYKNLIFNEEDIKNAKDEKSEINKFKTKVEEYRKNIMNEWKLPVQEFELKAKETEKLLTEVYQTINNQVIYYEDLMKEEIFKKCEDYFNELLIKENIDFINFEDMKMSITLGMQTKTGNLTKKVIEEIDTFVKSIVTDLLLIDLEEYKTEILVEYKKSLDASGSIIGVKNRMKAIEEEKIRQEELSKQKEEEIKVIEKVEEFTAPVEVVQKEIIIQEEIKSMTFKVFGTIEELKKVKIFLESEGIKYE